MRQRSTHPLPLREARVLATVKEYQGEGLDPSANAIALTLRGDYALERYGYLKMYGTLRSYSSRKIKTMVASLLKKGYLSDYAPEPFVERYLLLTPCGEAIAETLLSKRLKEKPRPKNIPLFNERN